MSDMTESTPARHYYRDPYEITTDSRRLDIDAIHTYLTHAYWSPGIPREQVAKAIHHSLCFGLYHGERQIGFARVVTDYATVAHLCDVYVLKTYRGRGLGVWLVDCVVNCPELAGIRSFRLSTRDAHGLYHKFGFQTVVDGSQQMFLRLEMPWYQPDLVDDD